MGREARRARASEREDNDRRRRNCRRRKALADRSGAGDGPSPAEWRWEGQTVVRGRPRCLKRSELRLGIICDIAEHRALALVIFLAEKNEGVMRDALDGRD